MARVRLQIEPDLCGPVSVGTVAIIKLVQRHFEFALDDAADCVNRCVFEREIVDISAPSADSAARFVAVVSTLPAVPRVVASVVVGDVDPADPSRFA